MRLYLCRFLSVVMAVALLVGATGCSEKETPSRAETSRQEFDSSLAVPEKPQSDAAADNIPLTTEQKAALEQQAVDFVLNFPVTFTSTAELDPNSVAWYILWKLYEQDPNAVDAQGYLYLSKAEVDAYAEQHFGIAEVNYTQDIPKFDEVTQTYAFMPIGEAPWRELDMGRVTFDKDGTVEYLLTLYDKAMGEEMQWRAFIGNYAYRFKICGEGGKSYLQAISRTDYYGETLTAEKISELHASAMPFVEKLLTRQGVDTSNHSVVLSSYGIVFANGEDCAGLYVTDDRDSKNEQLFECAISMDGKRFYYYQDGNYLPLAERWGCY